MTADAPRAGVALVVELRPGLAGLSSVVSVLHARLADVGDLSYAVSGDVAVLRVELGGTRLQALRLAAQVDRRVDVLSVAVLGPGASPARELPVDARADGSDGPVPRRVTGSGRLLA